jgi:UDP-N-acetylmuramoyl-L-alanyl-D-glutamate--2,6-diaminopimelate ligase
MDSRTAGPGSAFFCVTGATADGHDYAQAAAENGAACIVHSRPLPDLPADVFPVRVPDVQAALNEAAHVFYDKPSDRMTVFGVTGTNGKTTVATLLSELRSLWHPPATSGRSPISTTMPYPTSPTPHRMRSGCTGCCGRCWTTV